MLQRQLFAAYMKLYRPFINEINTALAPYQLFNSQYRIMRMLYQQEQSLTFHEIAKYAFIEKPSASNLIHKLISLGYVSTTEGSDKRQKNVCLTEEGRRVFEETDEMINHIIQPMLEGVSEEEQRIVICVMEQIAANLSQ